MCEKRKFGQTYEIGATFCIPASSCKKCSPAALSTVCLAAPGAASYWSKPANQGPAWKAAGVWHPCGGVEGMSRVCPVISLGSIVCNQPTFWYQGLSLQSRWNSNFIVSIPRSWATINPLGKYCKRLYWKWCKNNSGKSCILIERKTQFQSNKTVFGGLAQENSTHCLNSGFVSDQKYKSFEQKIPLSDFDQRCIRSAQ